MATLASGSNVTLTLSDYDSVTVSSHGPVLVEAITGLGLSAGKIIEFQGTQTFGPFSAGGQLKLTTYGRDAQYETADGKTPTNGMAFAFDDAGNITGLTSPNGGTLPLRGDLNLLPQNLNKWRAALAKVRNGTGRAKLALLGDSTTAGTGSAGTGSTNAVAKSYPSALAAMLNSYFAPATAASSWGKNLLPATDPRIAAPNWTTSSFVLNGNTLRSNVADTMTFTSGISWDTAEIWYSDLAGSGPISVNVDGGASIGSVTPSGTGLINKLTVTKTLGTGVLGVARTSGGSTYIAGVNVFDSTSPKVEVYNWGWHGSKVSDWATATASYVGSIPPTSNIPIVAPDLTVICLTINDASNVTALESYLANLQQIITAAKASGDVVLMSGVPSAITQISAGTQQAFAAACRSLAVSNNVPFISLGARFGSYEIANPLGMYSDTLHPLAIGYSDVAQAVGNVIGRP